MIKRMMSIGLPVLIVASFFLIMSNFKHADTLSASEERSIEIYQNILQKTKAENASLPAEDAEPDQAQGSKIDVLVQVYKQNEVIESGERGPRVAVLQEILQMKSDGFYGKGTEQAVKDFQLLNGHVVDGIVGPETLKLILDQTIGAEDITGDDA